MALPCPARGGFVHHKPLQTVAEKLGLSGESLMRTVVRTRCLIGFDTRGFGSDSRSEAEKEYVVDISPC